MRGILKRRLELEQMRQDYVQVTLIEKRGSVPQRVGAKALVTKSGLDFGTVGGGKVEARAISLAQELLADSHAESRLQTWNLRKDLGMSCGGRVSLFFDLERSAPRWKIAIFGAGHIAQQLVQSLRPFDCEVRIFDDRKEWLDRMEVHSRLQCIETQDPANAVRSLPRETQIVVMTQGHASDVPILHAALSQEPFAYVGVIGSLSKRKRLQADLLERGIDTERVESFFCPMGLPIGRSTPEEIAISVIGQLIWNRDAQAGVMEQRWQSMLKKAGMVPGDNEERQQ